MAVIVVFEDADFVTLAGHVAHEYETQLEAASVAAAIEFSTNFHRVHDVHAAMGYLDGPGLRVVRGLLSLPPSIPPE